MMPHQKVGIKIKFPFDYVDNSILTIVTQAKVRQSTGHLPACKAMAEFQHHNTATTAYISEPRCTEKPTIQDINVDQTNVSITTKNS